MLIFLIGIGIIGIGTPRSFFLYKAQECFEEFEVYLEGIALDTEVSVGLQGAEVQAQRAMIRLARLHHGVAAQDGLQVHTELRNSHGVRHLGMGASSPKMRIEKRKSARLPFLLLSASASTTEYLNRLNFCCKVARIAVKTLYLHP